MKDYASLYVSNKKEDEIAQIAATVMETGVKEKDAYHVACAVMAKCNYIITTDDRLLKYQSEKINLVTPGEFIRRMETEKMANAVNILEQGFACLVKNMGVIEAEYFISLIKREDFDYTVWQREYFDKMKPCEFAEKASAHAHSHPYTGNAQIL